MTAGRVVTCNEDWVAHGGDAELPADTFSLAEAKAVANAHAKKMGNKHAAVRIWKFECDYTAPIRKKSS